MFDYKKDVFYSERIRSHEVDESGKPVRMAYLGCFRYDSSQGIIHSEMIEAPHENGVSTIAVTADFVLTSGRYSLVKLWLRAVNIKPGANFGKTTLTLAASISLGTPDFSQDLNVASFIHQIQAANVYKMEKGYTFGVARKNKLYLWGMSKHKLKPSERL
jgi:hypothetical protein